MRRSRKKEYIHPGDVFSKWTVIKKYTVPAGEKQEKCWWCMCSCGRKRVLRQIDLLQGRSKHCNKCNFRPFVYPVREIGFTMGRWTVVGISRRHGDWGQLCYTCRCACGTYRVIRHCNFKEDKTRSCGCSRKEHRRSRDNKHTSNSGTNGGANFRMVAMASGD